MKIFKSTKLLLLIALCGLLFLSGAAFAQDTLVVEPGPLGVLNDAINADTLEDGSRKNLNRVYKLRRGARYILNGRIKSGDYHLRIVGEPDDPSNPMAPATLWPAVREDGGFDNIMLDAGADLTIKNVYFLGKVQTGNVVNDGIRLLNEGKRLIVDNCIFELIGTHSIRLMAPGQKAYITNNKFRNLINLTAGIFRGRAINCAHQWQDSLIVVNNTIMNHLAMAFQGRKKPINYFRWEHNTHVNTMKNTFHFEWWLESYIKNNLFINPHVAGEALSERKGQDPDGELMGSIMWIDTLSVDFFPDMEANGFKLKMESEEDRIIHFTHNNWYRDQVFDDYLNTIDSVEVEPLFNDRTIGFFAAYENMKNDNVTNIDPQFVNPPDVADNMLAFLQDFRSGVTPSERTPWDYQPDGDPLTLDWPLPENLSYATTSELYTAGDDGFPLGDLNWFPDKKAEWEEWIATDVVEFESATPVDFQLSQNYPNPFNPTTNIEYALNKKGHIQIAVYNMLGQKVNTLVDLKQSAGRYSVQWDGTDVQGRQMSSGVYYYQLESNGHKVTKKMVLMK